MLKNLIRNRRLLALLALTTAVVAFSSVAAFAAGSASVKVGDNFFRAKSLTVHKGAKVTWTWVGQKYHNVTLVSGPASFRPSRTQVRGTFSHIFTKKGTYHLYCSIHHSMRMTIVVR
jgi:plastocyanin